MRADRLVNMLLLLQARGRLTAARLADELEVSIRTILRDVDALNGAGVPVYTVRGPEGGIELLDGFRTQLTGFGRREAEALLLAGMPDVAAELGLGEAAGAARLKLLSVLAPELRDRAESLSGWLHVEPPPPVPHDRVARLASAIRDGRSLEVDGRPLAPLGLVLDAGRWFLVADEQGMLVVLSVNGFARLRVTGPLHPPRASVDLAALYRAGRRAGRPIRFPQ
jgi:predicted DNA-binding transcriptional regulator YafY